MDYRKTTDRLWFAVIEHLKIILRQSADTAPQRIAHDHRDQHFVDSRPKHRARRLRLRRSRLLPMRLKVRADEKRDPRAKRNRKEPYPRSHRLAEQLFHRVPAPFCPATARYRTTNVVLSDYLKSDCGLSAPQARPAGACDPHCFVSVPMIVSLGPAKYKSICVAVGFKCPMPLYCDFPFTLTVSAPKETDAPSIRFESGTCVFVNDVVTPFSTNVPAMVIEKSGFCVNATVMTIEPLALLVSLPVNVPFNGATVYPVSVPLIVAVDATEQF